jgi:serine/threonine protein phosphatase PrpC
MSAEQALVETKTPPNSTNPDENPLNRTSGEDATTNSANLHPAAAPEPQQLNNPDNPLLGHQSTDQANLKPNNPKNHQNITTNDHNAGHHKERSRSRSRARHSNHKSRSRSRSRGREHHHHGHHDHHHRSHRDEREEEEEETRGRSPGRSHHHDHHHHHHDHRHKKSSHHRQSRSRSRGRSGDKHARKRSRSRSLSPSPEKHHRHHHNHRHAPAAEINVEAKLETGTEPIASPSIDAATAPIEKTIVRHDSTLVALRPSASPRSFPISAFELAAEALKTPIPSSPYQEKLTLGPIVYGASQAKGMRPYMEDRHIIQEPLIPRGSSGAPIPDDTPRSFAAVYDGHNGTLAADHAADRLHFILATEPAFRTCTGDGPPATIHREGERITAALIHAFESTDKEILTRCRTENGRGGATGVVILRIGEMLYAAHCGDSRAVLCRRGEALRLTEDHKPNLPRERKRVEDLGGRVDFARCWRVIVDPGGGRPASGLAVSRSFGDPDFKEPLHLVTATPDVMSERLTEDDSFVILASDGLWDVMTDKRACEIVKNKIATAMANASGGGEKVPASFLATVAAQGLVQSALNAGTMDNVTAVVGLLKWS